MHPCNLPVCQAAYLVCWLKIYLGRCCNATGDCVGVAAARVDALGPAGLSSTSLLPGSGRRDPLRAAICGLRGLLFDGTL